MSDIYARARDLATGWASGALRSDFWTVTTHKARRLIEAAFVGGYTAGFCARAWEGWVAPVPGEVGGVTPGRARSAADDWICSSDDDGLAEAIPDDLLRRGFLTGAEWARGACEAIHAAEQDDRTIERAVGQQQLDEAGVVIRDAAALFRRYEKHHRSEGFRLHSGTPEHRDRYTKAETNRLMAVRLEGWLTERLDGLVADDPLAEPTPEDYLVAAFEMNAAPRVPVINEQEQA